MLVITTFTVYNEPDVHTDLRNPDTERHNDRILNHHQKCRRM